MKTCLIALGATVGLYASTLHAEVIYSLLSPMDNARQQYGNNYYYFGDDVTLPGSAPRKLQTLTLYFTNFDGALDYTPDIQVDIFEIGAVTRKPASSTAVPLGSASVDNITVPGDGASTVTEFVFDFTSQNITLPDHFGFFYHDNAAAANDPLSNALAVIISNSDNFTGPGSTEDFLISKNPNAPGIGSEFYYGGEDPGGWSGNFEGDPDPRNFIVEITAVPEPSTVMLLGVGFVGLMCHRRRR